jgi:hypothetical protein
MIYHREKGENEIIVHESIGRLFTAWGYGTTYVHVIGDKRREDKVNESWRVHLTKQKGERTGPSSKRSTIQLGRTELEQCDLGGSMKLTERFYPYSFYSMHILKDW